MSVWTVYLHRAADDRVLYVGCTVSLGRRTSEHAATAAWWPEVVTVESIASFAAKVDALECERVMIGRLDAQHNTVGARSVPATDEMRERFALMDRLLEPVSRRREKEVLSRALPGRRYVA